MTGLLGSSKEEESSEIMEERPAGTMPDPPQEISQSDSEIGISSLMNKRAKLEEAIDYVGGLIANLKEKRTNLEKEIEEESVDIKNLKEKLIG